MSPYLAAFECLVYGLFTACLVSAFRRGRFEALELVWTGLYGFLLEWMTIKLLHAYQYGQFAVMLDGAPLAVALGWAVIIYTGMRFSSRVGLPEATRPVLDALMALNVDLALDAIAVRLGMWAWSGVALDQQWFGVPWGNFWAWFLVVWSYSAFLRALRPWRGKPVRRWLYPPVAVALSLFVLAVGGGVSRFVVDKETQGLTSVLLLAGCVATVWSLKPRIDDRGPTERIVTAAPLVFHGFALVTGLTSGIFSRQPALAAVGLAMLAVSLFIHGWPWKPHGRSLPQLPR